MEALLDQLTSELDGIDAIYSDEKVIALPAELTHIAKHLLMPKP
jgi:hypothetical protein